MPLAIENDMIDFKSSIMKDKGHQKGNFFNYRKYLSIVGKNYKLNFDKIGI